MVVEIKAGRILGGAEVSHFVQLARALRGEADLFLLVSTGRVTKHARAIAQQTGVHLLELKDLAGSAVRGADKPRYEPETRLGSPDRRTTVFVSYSHKDRRSLERLQVHLRPLERDGLIDLWADTSLKAGEPWGEEIQAAIDRARVAVVLVSADFLASEFIATNELLPLLAKAKSEGAKVMPVILSACEFTRHKDLGTYQAVNDPDRLLADHSRPERERIWDSLARDIIDLVRT